MSKLGRGLLKSLRQAVDTVGLDKKKPLHKRLWTAFYTSDYTDKLFDSYYAVRRLVRKCIKVIQFLPYVWRFEDWDSSYVMEFNAYLYKRLYKGCYEEGHHVFKPTEARKLKTVIALCERLSRDHDYTDAHYDAHMKKWGKDQDSFMDHLVKKTIDGKTYSVYEDPVRTRSTPEEYAQYRKEADAIHKLEDYLFQQDLDLLHKLLKKNFKKWWD